MDSSQSIIILSHDGLHIPDQGYAIREFANTLTRYTISRLQRMKWNRYLGFHSNLSCNLFLSSFYFKTYTNSLLLDKPNSSKYNSH
ncbi:hypothetical protein GIB67_031206, partial [Kingdonia uniflora]